MATATNQPTGAAQSSDARPVLVCPDKFRGTFSALEIAAAVELSLARHGITSDICAMADGGEGTLEIIGNAVEAEFLTVAGCDALGRACDAPIALYDDGKRALIESAKFIGLAQIAEQDRQAELASSRGVGEAIATAAELGVQEIVVGIGGTASTDGGLGALTALRESGWLASGGEATGKTLPRITVLCDARVEWLQAATMFSPQKGANAAASERLRDRLTSYALELPRDPSAQLMSGCGGGLAGGLWSTANAELKNGAAYVLDTLNFSARMVAARAVITGEGKLDRQTLLGKGVCEVATRARQAGVPCHAIVGS
ncbi:MAG: glycerate kinase, partial [Thermoleophilaceae bacterium]|nr:glycerate kinase [Thermoleophilaceae bacterium]